MYCPLHSAINMLSVRFVSRVMMIVGQSRSFHAHRSTMMPIAVKMEVESGNRICKKIRVMEQPSIFAASSSSDGKLRKFCRMKNVTLILIKLA